MSFFIYIIAHYLEQSVNERIVGMPPFLPSAEGEGGVGQATGGRRARGSFRFSRQRTLRGAGIKKGTAKCGPCW